MSAGNYIFIPALYQNPGRTERDGTLYITGCEDTVGWTTDDG